MSERTIVRYNRQRKTWQAINGRVQCFGTGKMAKRKALQAALKHDHPELFRAVVGYWAGHFVDGQEDALMDRLLKAAGLIAKGHVFDNGRVQSQSEPDVTYTVQRGGCDCMDWQNGLLRRSGQAKWGGVDTCDGELHCKHSLAQLLATIAGVELPGEPIPF